MKFTHFCDITDSINKRFGGAIEFEIINEKADLLITKVGSLELADKNTLSFALATIPSEKVENTGAGALIVDNKYRELILKKNISAITTKNVYLLFAKASYLFYKQPEPVIDNCANSQQIINKSPLHPSVKIGAFSVIEKNVEIGENSQIGSHANIGENVRIGKNCLIYANVSIYPNTLIGDNVIIHSGAVLGADGFGFTPEISKNTQSWFKIPQHGKVVINNNVEIGANCAIDRGALQDTIIGEGVKMDNFVQVGHGANIGAHTLLMACSAVSGSVTVGKNCLIGGQTGLGPGITLCDNVMIHPQAFVVQSVNTAGEYSGAWPLQKHRQWLRTQVKLRKI